MSMTDAATIGHNRPPPYDPAKIEALRERVNAFAEAAGQWLDLGKITDEESAALLNDFINGSRKLAAEIDKERKAQKEPHRRRAEVVDAAFSTLTEPVEKIVARLKPIMTGYLAEKQRQIDAEKEAARREAARLAEEARIAAAQAAARNDVVGEAEAERLQAEAAKAQKAAEKPVSANVRSGTGGGRTMALRANRYAVVDDINLAFVTFRRHPDLTELLNRLATAQVRAAGWDGTVPPGFRVEKEETAA
jgi:polyhydroxyalkanoate synthesis regulator phasin